MEVVVLKNLSSSTRSGFGVYRYPLPKVMLTMLSRRLMLLLHNQCMHLAVRRTRRAILKYLGPFS
jgi:hypothetical protein